MISLHNQVHGFYRFRLGGFIVTMLKDGVDKRPLADGFEFVPAQWSPLV